MLDLIVGIHVQFINFGLLEVIVENRNILLGIKLIFFRVLSWRDKYQCLIAVLKLFDPIFAPQYPLPQLVDSLILLF
jgi:hypothetical protein